MDGPKGIAKKTPKGNKPKKELAPKKSLEDLDAELLALTLRHTSREFMLQHQDKFDDSMLRQLSEDVADLPRGSASAKVTSGSSTSLLGDSTLEAIALVWQEEITTSLGFDTYQDLLAARSLEA